MRKSVLLGTVVMSLLMFNSSYAECNHNYIKEYNYSVEVNKIVDKHFYREKCNKCFDIKSTKDVMYENCNYSGEKCALCNAKKEEMPQYDIKLSKENQNYVYQNCQKYSIIDSYKALIATIYRKSEFNESLVNGANKGLFQLNSLYDYSWLIGRENYDLLDPKDNIEIGVALYNWYYERFNDSIWKTVVAVNSGIASEDMKNFMVDPETGANVRSLNEIANLIFQLRFNSKL